MVGRIFLNHLNGSLAVEQEFPLYREEQPLILLKANRMKDFGQKCCKVICSAALKVVSERQNDYF